MRRPPAQSYFDIPYSFKESNESFVALRILLNKLEVLFETVEPTVSNKDVYGHKIRELLMLACLEVESPCTAILKEHEYPSKDRWSTKDYARLLDPRKLDKYLTRLTSYDYPDLNPFKDWDHTKATQSLPWYNAYNKTKHNREENLKLATLEHTINAVGAAVIMMYAQFGFRPLASTLGHADSRIRSLFETEVDMAAANSDFYIPDLKIDAMGHISMTGNWIAENYPFPQT